MIHEPMVEHDRSAGRSCPLVTVAMPVHNVAPYIGPAIRSILSQTFEDFELWILENGSTDNTLEIATEFQDQRIRIFDLGRSGFQGALAYALEHARSPWIARMDGDDLSHPRRLERQMSLLSERPEVSLVGTAYSTMTPF